MKLEIKPLQDHIVQRWNTLHTRLHNTHLSAMQVLIGFTGIGVFTIALLATAQWAGYSPSALWADNDTNALRNQLLEMHQKIDAMQNLKNQFASMANPLPAQLASNRSAPIETKIIPVDSMAFAPLENKTPDAKELLKAATAMNERLEIAEKQWLGELRVLHQLPTGSPISKNTGMSSNYGTRIDPFTRTLTHHAGIDFSAAYGTPIMATGDGTVAKIDVDRNNGQYVDIEHASGFTTRYAHVSSFAVREGEAVKRGQTIANVGNTGRSTSAHLHYEIRYQGIPINPLQALSVKPNQQMASSPSSQTR
ncbi:M23 family metallopeptidase [Polynucleobacter sp. MG-28-Ekke-A2]|uniref:M23 family metallopeptidase n=1 Tax=Polynucleobacter sp. MG-28-Ekke-A2 TaxID=3108276 RepID=UPI002B22BE2F|nr:M23 family metallopeptidase [Polynucleobacter sp. MG-28-Ekke-A2]MEA9601210.1 M23 family metallopeptidase [Polynucleobacter sp. MG-28-Ekke-A2]